MRRFLMTALLTAIVLGATALKMPALAQEESTPQPAYPVPDLLLFTKFPSQVIGIGEAVTINLSLRSGAAPQVVKLELKDVPENWSATFRGEGRIVDSVFVQPEIDSGVELRLEPPADITPGVYSLTAIATGDDATSELPLELTVQERVPASLEMTVDLPVLRGNPSTTFRYNVTLNNKGGDDLTVNLLSQAPPFFGVTFKLGSQEVTSLPVEASSTKRISVEATSLLRVVPAGTYPISIAAQGGEAQATLDLQAEVVGQADLTLTTPDERLSGDAEIGSETAVQLVILNNGSAPARAVKMTASPPSGWSITFEPQEIEEIAPASQTEVTARVRPADKAIAGDYMVTFRAQPDEGAEESAQYRVTVRTSTLWGLVGVGLIAVAVIVVGAAVMRFGRR